MCITDVGKIFCCTYDGNRVGSKRLKFYSQPCAACVTLTIGKRHVSDTYEGGNYSCRELSPKHFLMNA